MRVSYNGYYISFPRKRREFDSLHPHQETRTNARIRCSFLKWGREKTRAFLLGILCFTLCCVGFLSPNATSANALPAPEVALSSPRVIIYNLNDDKVLYEKDADTEVPVASLTKIMTAVIVLENNFSATQTVTITTDMLENLEEFSIVGLKVGQQISVDELMYALMLPSAGDAAQALAINVSGSLDDFVTKMNQKVQELGLKHTHFSNAVGFDDNNYSSARDIALLTKYALNVPNFRTYFEANEHFLPSLNQTVTKTVSDTAKKYGLNTDVILGAKTGYTNAAGINLASTSVSLKNVNYLAVNLNAPVGTPDNITDTLKLYHYYDDNYSYRTVKNTGEGIMDISVRDSSQKIYTLTAPAEIKIFLPNDLDLARLQYSYDGISEIPRGTAEGDYLGKITVSLDGENLSSFDVYLAQKIDFYPYELWIGGGIVTTVIVVIIIVRRTRRRV